MTTATAKAPKERPLILGSADVRSILDGTKTHFRIVVDPAPFQSESRPGWWLRSRTGRVCSYDTNARRREVRDRKTGKLLESGEYLVPLEEWLIGLCPLGRVGDLIWVRETWCHKVDDAGCLSPEAFWYRADGHDVRKVDGDGFQVFRKDGSEASPWASASSMPREASRITLRITDVGLDDISGLNVKGRLDEGFPKWARGDRAWRVGFERTWGEHDGHRGGRSDRDGR